MWGRRRNPKPGGYARARASDRSLLLLRTVAPHLVAASVVYGVVAVLAWQIFDLSDFFMGVVVTVPFIVMALFVVGDPSAAAWRAGADAEEWTHTALRKALGKTATVVSDLQLSDRNIDHVVVCPAGIFAVETKYRSDDWRERRGRRLQRQAAAQVEAAARELRDLLHAKAFPVEVTTLVVLWGGGIKGRWKGLYVRREHRTDIVAGIGLKEWAATLDPSRLSTVQCEELSQTVQRLVEERWQEYRSRT